MSSDDFVVYRLDGRPFQIKGEFDTNITRVLGAVSESGAFEAHVARPATVEELAMWRQLQQYQRLIETLEYQSEVADAKLDVALANASELGGEEPARRAGRLDELVARAKEEASQ